MANAPIALFAFNRPEHTRRALESLAKNPEFDSSHLFVYCDGARFEADMALVEATRRLVRAWPHPNKTLIEQGQNLGLANSVTAGVTELCEKFDRVIVVEDDLVLSPIFLSYINAALDRYAEDPRIMQVSGYMFPIDDDNRNSVFMLPITSTWGWATWNRAWKKFPAVGSGDLSFLRDSKEKRSFNLDNSYPYIRRLKNQLKGRSDSWGIKWYVTVFNCRGLVVYPSRSLVKNIGHDGSGTHCGFDAKLQNISDLAEVDMFALSEDIYVDEDIFGEVKEYLRRENRLINRIFVRLKTISMRIRRKSVREFK